MERYEHAPRLEATLTVNHHPVKVTVEGSGCDNPEQTLRDITAHVKRVEAEQQPTP